MSTICCGAGFHAPDELWEKAGYVCFQDGHLALVIVAVSLAIGFVGFVTIFEFVFVDSNPLSPGHEGRSSGRALVLMLFWKVRYCVCD
jgi:hypothetical protein